MATIVSTTDHSTVLRPESSSADSPAMPSAYGAAAESREHDAAVGDGRAVGGLGTVGDAAVAAVTLPLSVARTVLGPRRLPVFLGTTALVVLGVVDPPVALGAGLAIEALRRWHPPMSG